MSIAPYLRRLRQAADPTGLGPLERQVMEILWAPAADGTVGAAGESAAASVREVRARLGGTIAYTTVMTTLDRLHRKGLLERTRAGRAFLYRAALSRAELERGLAVSLLQALLGIGGAAAGARAPAPEPILSSIVEAVGDRDKALLDELERLVRARRRRDRGPR